MSYTIHKKELFDIIQKAYPIVPLKNSLQMLLNFKLKFSPHQLEVVATDLDHSIKLKCPIEGSDEFEVAVHARKLFEIIKELHDDIVTIDCDENVVLLESGGSFTCRIAGADPLEFPEFPEYENNQSIEIPIKYLKDMIVKSNFAVSKEDARACLRGILWEIENDKTGMIATDGHRLGSSFYTGMFNVEEKLSLILSPKSLLHLVRILESDTEEAVVRVIIGEKYIFFENDTITLCSKLIDGPYPDYEKVIPDNNPKKAFVETKPLLDAIRRVAVLSNQKTHLIKCIFKKDLLDITVVNRDIGGEARQIIPIAYEEEEHVVGFNAAYFYEILSIIKTNTIRMEMNTQISACLIFPVFENEEDKKSEDLFLIMPLRILEELYE